MGVPKFFRYISERYPCLSELVKEYEIPTFDNLYLDMNGIIHMCSHPDDGNAHFRITEEKIFADIFHYIEILFRMIKPQKLFFMAIDGVAPRAKMNQQRGRRFRSAKEAERLETRAKDKGELLPTEARFDSNCITPGTVFMARLHEQLKYFIVNKISTDKLWKSCKIILSGHETPGEGEHKIMDYIRYLRAQPGHDPNTRHCLYGLDADLIMLGLCTHEPHFSLLREEVHFGKKATKRTNVPEQATFFLLHLSLMREYLSLEFAPLKDSLQFAYDLEHIIDDWVMMGFLVGNDFIPPLPNLHIANGALPMLYKTYMKVLPTLKGYINENGQLNLERFEKFMEALCEVDLEHFTEQYADLKYFEAKTGRRMNTGTRPSYTKIRKLETWKPDEEEEDFISFEELEGGGESKPKNSDLAKLIQATEDMLLDTMLRTNFDGDDDDVGNDDEFYDEDGMLSAEFKLHKRDYYMNKLDYAQVTPEVMRAQAEGYVRAIQWNLNYYYNGVCSWGWYYPHHYAPFISDIKDFKDLKFDFELGKPFKPYEQLLGVLPTASKDLLPETYHKLMTDDNSSIREYYPLEFATDLNGKKQDWEAVVLIPFIDEKRLLDAMATCNGDLSEEERDRNGHGPMLCYTYTDVNVGPYEAPQYFPTIEKSFAHCVPIELVDIRIPVEKLVKGAYPNHAMDIFYPGFPTLRHVQFTFGLERAKVKVFEQPSRNDNMILTVVEETPPDIEEIAKSLIGKTVFAGWPHLQEAFVVSLSTKESRYKKTHDGQLSVEKKQGNLENIWALEKENITEHYKNRLGIEIGETSILVHVKMLCGRKYIFTPQSKVTLEKQWSSSLTGIPYQIIVKDLDSFNQEYKKFKDVADVFKVGTECFMLGQPHYGAMGLVMDSKDTLVKGRIRVQFRVHEDPSFDQARALENDLNRSYVNLHMAARKLDISKHLLSRITGSLFVVMGEKKERVCEEVARVNIGLNLKYNKRNEEIPGYTKKVNNIWLYSQRALELVEEFLHKFPRVYEYLMDNIDADFFYEYELFPDDEGSGKSVREIVEWMKAQPVSSIEHQISGSLLLEPDVVKYVEDVIDQYIGTSKHVMIQVKPHLLFKPDLQFGNIPPDSTTTYQIYDRVINVRESYTVPLGSTGTVIAMHKPSSGKSEDFMYDVLFDKPFVGGLPLNCSPNRGYRMSQLELINKSHGIRQLEQKGNKTGPSLQQTISNVQHYQQQQQQQQQPPQSHNQSNNMFVRSSVPQMAYMRPQNSAFVSWNNPSFQPIPNPLPQFQNFIPYHHPANAPPMPPPAQIHPLSLINRNMPNFVPRLQSPQLPPNAGGGNVTNASPSSKKNDFMPSFASTSSTSKTSDSSTNSRNRQQVECSNLADTDILKKMLKIDGNGDDVQVTKRNEALHPSVQNIFAAAEMKGFVMQCDKTQQQQPESFSLRLLTYYQSHGLGCPHYKYFNSVDGKQCRAQIVIPVSNEAIFGNFADSREDACENVAEIVWNKLNANLQAQPKNQQMMIKFPNPPKQWCTTGGDRKGSPLKACVVNAPVHQMKTHSAGGNFNGRSHPSGGNGGGNSANNNGNHHRQNGAQFVPLQAVRQQRSYYSNKQQMLMGSNKAMDSTAHHHHHNHHKQMMGKDGSGSDERMMKSNYGGGNLKTNQPKPRRERKMRIAANFSGATSQSQPKL